jgi:putative transposase
LVSDSNVKACQRPASGARRGQDAGLSGWPGRYARRPKADPENDGAGGVAGHRHGHRSRSLLGTFGRVEIAVPRARLDTAEGKTTEWKSKALRAYQRRTTQAASLIAGAYLAGTNTRRVRRALAAVFGGAVSKSLPSRRRGIR